MADKDISIDNKSTFLWNGILWSSNDNFLYDFITLCPKNKCCFPLILSDSDNELNCRKCSYNVKLKQSYIFMQSELSDLVRANYYKNLKVVNIDGELLLVKKAYAEDENYWAEVKISKNKKGEVQLMILSGNKKLKNKTQLFLDIQNEKMTFDQNDDHPKEVFTKVTAVFKNSQMEIAEQVQPNLDKP